MEQYQILLDAPDNPRHRVQIATLGEFKDKRYGEFSITRDDVDQWARNLEYLPGKRALIDLDHRADRAPRNTEAAGWITRIDWEDDRPVAEVEWTPVGKQAIEQKRYLFFSPTYGPHKTEDGEVHDNTLVGGALTNKPFLTGMPAISLASDETVEAALHLLEAENARRLHDVLEERQLLDVSAASRQDAKDSGDTMPDGSYPVRNQSEANKAWNLRNNSKTYSAAQIIAHIRRQVKKHGLTMPGGSSDTRRSMDAELLKTLGLDDDPELEPALAELPEAQVQKILDAVTALKAEADKPAPEPQPETRSLEQQAEAEGKIVLDAATFAEVNRKAESGEAAMKRLHQQAFEHAFDAAVKDRKVTPAERETLQRFYELDAEAALKSLEERQPVVPDAPTGAPTIDLSQEEVEPELLVQHGVHPGGHQLNQQIEAYLREHSLPDSDFPKLLDRYMQQGRL